MIKKLITLGLFSISAISFAQKVSVMPSVGFAWRTAEMPKGITYEERNYIKGLKKGVNFDISAYYHVNHILGVGLKFSNYSASSDGRLTVMDNQGNVITGNVSTKDNITFFDPALMISNFSEQTKHKMFIDMGLGVISYTTKTGSVKGTGSNLGAELNFGYQYQVSKNFLIQSKTGSYCRNAQQNEVQRCYV
ncbi:hypothetical protein [Chryseobacterium wanjuense]